MKINEETLRLFAEFSPRRNRFDLFLFANSRDTNLAPVSYVALKPEFVKYGEASPVEPFISLPKDLIQPLMDDLYNAGFRPTIEVETANGIKATEKHLEDMRIIASHYGKFKLEENKC